MSAGAGTPPPATVAHGLRLPSLCGGYVAACTVAVVVYFVVRPVPGLPGWLPKVVLYDTVSLSAVVALAVGMVRYRPRHRTPWVLLLLAQVTYLAADVCFYTYHDVLGDTSYPAPADAIYLAHYPVLAAALFAFARQRRLHADPDSVLDAMIPAAGLAIVSTTFLVLPSIDAPGMDLLARAVSATYPAMDVLVLTMALLLASGGRRDTPAFYLLCAALATVLLTDAAYTLAQVYGIYSTGDALDASWMASYIFLGAAALHPSMTTLSSPTPPATRTLWRARLLSISAALVLVPTTMIAFGLVYQHRDALVFGALSLVTIGLVMLRLRATTWELAQTRRLQDELRHEALHDALTGVGNRTLLSDRLEHALLKRARTSEGLALMLIDLDDFKDVNDSLGHEAGDTVLVEVARRMGAVLRPGDTIARLGGDEFAVVFESVTSMDAVERAAVRVLTAIRLPIAPTPDSTTVIGASVGLIEATGHASAAELLRNADAAMYAAKAGGKNRIVHYEPAMREPSVRRLEVAVGLRRALRSRQLEVHYQPIVDARSGDVVSAEALVRWRHPTLGLLAAGRFMDVAEATGLVDRIGAWVLDESCRRARSWMDAGHPIRVSVNVSARQLQDQQLVPTVRQAIKSAGLPPDRLTLELTETALVRDVTEARRQLTALRDLGIGIAIDDFGRGQSSIAYLAQFPVDVVKVEVDLLGDERTGGPPHALMRGVVALARDIGLEVVVEGVESESQLAAVLGCGATLIQGWLFGKGVPGDAFEFHHRRVSHEVLTRSGPLRARA